jgi:hypothetical protein
MQQRGRWSGAFYTAAHPLAIDAAEPPDSNANALDMSNLPRCSIRAAIESDTLVEIVQITEMIHQRDSRERMNEYMYAARVYDSNDAYMASDLRTTRAARFTFFSTRSSKKHSGRSHLSTDRAHRAKRIPRRPSQCLICCSPL